MRSRLTNVLAAGTAIFLGGSLLAASASVATAAAAPLVKHKHAAFALPETVSQSPVAYTPNISGHNTCGKLCSNSTVYSTAVVNGEVVVAGSFSQACSPAPASYAQCPSTVAANYLLAFNISTGAIDPHFAPKFTGGPANSVTPGPGDTVYVAGAFTAVNGKATGGLAALNVDPGQSNDGRLVGGFGAKVTGAVISVAFDGSNALYVAGRFTEVDGTAVKDIARVNATTGALDSTFKFTLSGNVKGNAVQVNTMSLAPDGDTLAIGGMFFDVNGKSIPRVALISTGGGLGKTATLDNWSAPILANNCTREHNYLNAIDFSPDGSFFAIATNGYQAGTKPGICDALARFPANVTGTDIQPTWINYTGGDSFFSVTVVGNVIYGGGHNRWVNNECGANIVCEQNAVLVNGLSAFDTNTGLALPWWHPQTLRKVGVQTLVPFSAAQDPGTDGGLIVGTDATVIGGANHSEIAIFPEPSTSALTPGGPIPSGMFSQGRIGGHDGSTAGTAEMCVDDPGNSTTPGTVVDFSTCTNGNEQNWTVQPDGEIQVNGLCLDTAGEQTSSGTKVALASCTGASTQLWTQGSGNTVTNNGASGMCLTDPNDPSTGQPSLVNGTSLEITTCSGAAAQVWPLPVAQAPPAPPPTGALYPDQNQAKTDNVPCASSASKHPKAGTTLVELERCLGYIDQTWTLQPNGELQIYGLCLDTVGEGTTSGTKVDLNTCSGSATQTWTPKSDFELADGAGLCLDEASPASGTDLQIASCNDAKGQQWRLPAY